MKYPLLLPFFIFILCTKITFCKAKTNEELAPYFDKLKNYQFQEALKIAESSNVSYKPDLILFARLLENNGYPHEKDLGLQIEQLELKIDDLKVKQVLFYLIKGYHAMNDPNKRSDAFELFIEARALADEIGHQNMLKFSLLGILRLYRSGVLLSDDKFKIYLEDYKELCEDSIDLMHYYTLFYNLYHQTVIAGQDTKQLDSLAKVTMNSMDSLKELIPNNNKVLIHYYSDKASFISLDNNNAAENYYLKALEYTDNSNFFKYHKFNIILHLARIKTKNTQYQRALEYANEAIKFINPNDSLKQTYYVSGYKADIHGFLGNYDSAFVNMRASRYLEYELDFQKENAQIAKLEVENKTKQKELENLELKSKNTRNNNLLIASLIVIVLGSLIAVLIFKNIKRKQLLAEQDKSLQAQRLSTVLKEQELRSIDAMIEGQEKERQRIANDLHDDLGSVMTNLKLHINALKESKNEELYDKTNKLVEEAYDKVRTVSHAKNSGVMAKLGLLKAIQNMAKNISDTNKVQIEVVYHGLDERLENSLELTIFRIIQELITNILKHAEAKEVTINLIQHDDSLNIMVEDDGIGFKTTNITTSNSGMGLSSIDKRVEHLNGELTIESELGKGTTIIIDIPI